MEKEISDYAVCEKCGKRYSTLTRHRCFKAKGQDEKPKFDPPKVDESGPGAGGGEGEGQQGKSQDGENQGKGKGQGKGNEGSGQGSGEGQGEGEGEGEGEGQGEGEGEGSGEGEGEGSGQGQGEGEGEGQAPEPKLPDPETPPVAVVCTVLKFAALTAQCAKNGTICVELIEDGMFVYGHNGDVVAHGTIPWGEFEKRSTIDGEFYVKEIIDKIDERLLAKPVDIDAMLETYRPAAEKAAPKPKLTLPFFVGQRVVGVSGCKGTVTDVNFKPYNGEEAIRVQWAHGSNYWHNKSNGKIGRPDYSDINDYDIVADDEGKYSSFPLTAGQRVTFKNGYEGNVTDNFTLGGPSGREEHVEIYHDKDDCTWWHRVKDGKFVRDNYRVKDDRDVI